MKELYLIGGLIVIMLGFLGYISHLKVECIKNSQTAEQLIICERTF